MSKSKRPIYFTVSVILVFLMAFLLPIQVFAETTPEPKPEESVTFDSLVEGEENANIVSELKERRDEYTKHFRMDDGTIMAVTYDCPVHYKNDKGKWVEYDNSLIAESEATPDEIAPEPFTNKKSNMDIELAPETKTDNLVKIDSKKGSITWKYTGAKKSNAKVKNNNIRHRGNAKFTSIDKLTSQASYKNIYNNVDLDCIVSTTGVKENIVLKNDDAQNEFQIEYNIKGFNAKQIDNKTIHLTNKNGKKIYTISAPYMYDADGNTSKDITFKIISNKANILKVKLTADRGFLNSWGRAYPVTIDPEVSLNGYANTETAEVKSSQADTVQGQSTHFHVGDVYSGLIKLKNVQENYSDKNIVSAKVILSPMSTSSEMEIEAYPITSSWTNNTATFNNVSYGSEVIDYVKTKANSSDVVSLDLTKYVKKWANSTVANNGVYLKSTDTATDFGGYQCYFSNKKPTFVVKYKEYTGSESNLTSHTVSCGQNADASVSDYTGALTIKQKIYEEKGLRIPLNIYATHHSTNIAQRSYIGKGWHMSFDKRLTNTGTYYVYLDSDAVEHYFRIVSGKTELEDEDDLGLTLKIKSNSIEIDNGSTIETFSIPANNETKYIQTEKDSNNSNNIITYNYGSTGYLSSIVSAQHTYTFSYSTVTSDGESVKICNNIKKDNTAFVSFIYYTGYSLTSGIKFADGKRSSFGYTTSNCYLGTIRQYSTSDSQNGQKLGFTYTSGKVTKITEYGKNDASRKSLSVKYNTNNTTEFTDLNGNRETYTFDDYGNTISTLNANGMVTNGSDSGSLGIVTGSDSYTKNYIEVSNEPTALGTNQYYRKANGTIGNQTSSGGTVTIDENNSYLGSKSIKVNHSGASQIYTYAMHENNADDIKGKTVTLSAYVKTKNISEGSLSGGAGAIVKFKALNGSTTLLDVNSVALQDTVTGSEWERISLTVDVPSDTTSYRIYFALRNAQGTAWFDCMQLEEGDVMNDYNALANSDFTSTSDWIYKYKDTGDTSFHTTQIPLNNDGDVHLSGKGCEPQSVQAQNVEEETEPTAATEVRTETETVDNDIVEETDAYGNVTKTMQGKVTRTYRRTYEVTEATEATTSSSNSSGNDANVDSVGECNNYIYQILDVNKKSVTFNISGTASAKSVPLNSDYRTFGIALKVKYQGDSDYTENHYQEFNAYTDATQNITLSVTPDESDRVVEKVAFAFVYGYNKNEMIIKNAMLNFAYDYQFGGNEENNSSSSGTNSADAINEEIISESVSTAQTYMETNTAYNSTCNYITSETDEAGHTTSYSYDSDGNKTSVTDPKNNTTSYTYDTYGNILSVASGNSSYNNTYTSTGQLSTISNSGTSYSFEYDNFDNVTKVKVGTQTLVTNTYDSLCDKLTRVTYGNGQSLIYSYDDYGRITGIDVHNGTLARYSYNKKGLITKYEDHWLRQTTYFFYDCNGNMIAKYAESDDKDLAFNISFDSDNNTVEQTNVNGRLQNIIRGTDAEENEYVSYDGIKVTTETDDFGRTTKTDTHYEGDLDYSPFYTTYGYKNGSGTNSTTNIVNSVKHYTKTASNYDDHKIAQYDYTYDANGNITQVTLNDTVIAKYSYDSLNQLSTSADKNANEFVEYTYDTKGNITQKKKYSLTSSLTKGTLQDTKTYTYGDTNWGDKLTSYNGTTITYDNIGNPLSYRDGMTMSWMVGRSLSQITKSNKTYSFKYNADGLRTEKKCATDGDTHHYYYDSNGNMIAFRRNNAAVVYFYYDSQGNVTSMSFEGTKYFFIKNIQGDVEKIVTHQGNVAVTYKYDAWGKLISKTDNTVYGIGELNPFRYRGYIYDDETGLYYLKSRYYDPITGRFLNADDTAILLMTSNISRNNNEVPSLGMSNLFAYCENNPIKYTDPDGYVTPANVIGAVIGGIIGAIGGFFLTNWLADKLKLHGWKRNLFVWGLTAVITAAAAVIGYFIGPYVARIATKLARFVLKQIEKGKIIFKRLAKNAKTAIRTLGKAACFVAGTQIMSENGTVSIEKIKVNDYVWSENPKTGEKGLKKVKKTFLNKTNVIVRVKCCDDEILTTENHPFWVKNKEWVEASNLCIGDYVKQSNGNYILVTDINIEILNTQINVYNFEVEDWHTYFVSSRNVLVHNMCAKEFIRSAKNAKQVISYLKKQGFQVISQNGSHVKLSDGLKTVIVPKHGAKDIAIGTLRSIMKQAGLL